MSNTRQVIFSINTDDLVRPSTEAKYPVGGVYELDDEVATFPRKITTKFIYLKSKITTAQFQPFVLNETGIPLEEAFPLVPYTVGGNSPFLFICVPQILVPVNNYAFFLFEGKGKVLGKDTILIDSYLRVQENDTAARADGTVFTNEAFGHALEAHVGASEDAIDFLLFNKTATINA